MKDHLLQGMLEPRRLFFFEKWYFDGQTEDGAFFLVYLAPMILAGKRSAELVACLFPPGGGEHRVSLHLKGRDVDLAEDRTRAAFPGGELSLDTEECRFALDRGDLRLDLRYRPMDPPWVPAGHGLLRRQGERSLRWIVPVPRAALSGTVRVAGADLRLEGSSLGYSDFVQTDIPPWRLPLRELLWGRALGEEILVIWDRASFTQGKQLTHASRGLVRLGAEERREVDEVVPAVESWCEHPATREGYPLEMGLRLGELDVSLDRTRLLLGDFVTDVQGFRSKTERWLYRTFTGNPVEYKLLSSARTEGVREALAAHELVLWGRGR